MDKNKEVVGLTNSPTDAYELALNSDNEEFSIVRETRLGRNIDYDYYNGSLFGDWNSNDLYDESGYLKDEVKRAVINEIERSFGIKEVNQSVDTNAKVEGRKPIDKNVDATLLAKSISTAFADAFSTFKASQERLIKAQNDFLKLKKSYT